MYCSKCGQQIGEMSVFCNNCGYQVGNTTNQINDAPNKGFAIIGFFIPLVGLILYLIFEGKQPLKAKSAGKGALIGFITGIVVCIGLYVALFAFTMYSFNNHVKSNSSKYSSSQYGSKTEEILDKYLDVNIGEFEIKNSGYFPETKLNVTVKNKADKNCTYYITIEAVDETGARLKTDMLFADKLNSGQAMHLEAFKYVEQENLEKFKKAKFKVLEVVKYDF